MAASLLHTDHTVPSGKGENHHHHHHHQQQHHQHTSTVSTTAETLPWPGLAWFIIPSFHYGVNFCSKVKPWASDCDGKHGRLLQNKRVAWEFVTSDGFFWCRKGTWNSFWKAFGPLSKLCSILLQVAILEMRICGYLRHSFLKKSALQKCRNSEKGHMGHHWSYDWYKASRLKAVREEYVGMFWVVSIWLKLWRKGELGLRYQKLTKIWSGLSAIVCQFATFCLQLWVQASVAFEVPGSFFSPGDQWDVLHFALRTERPCARNAEWAPWKNGHRRCGFPVLRAMCYGTLAARDMWQKTWQKIHRPWSKTMNIMT